MPPEPLPWDRRDFRKHERSDPARVGTAGGFRWRDLPHPLHPPPPHTHHPYHHHQQQRWFSDFRSRPLPPGHGKQGGWHMYPVESVRGFLPYGSRFNERNLDDENSRPFVTRGNGRYLRNSRENKGSFSQKDWKVNSWEPPTLPTRLGKLDNEVNDQRSVGNMQTCNNDNHHHNINNCQPDPNFENSCDQSQVKCQLDENGSSADGLGSTGQQIEIESSLGSQDCKPLKWTRSESLSSRGSGFSHSSSSKSIGADSSEMKAELQPKIMVPVQSPPGEASACLKSFVPTPAPPEESCSRKKPRLGWGEGLAKYEKKNVDPEDGPTKDGLVISDNKIEPAPTLSADVATRTPRVAVFLDDFSHATTSSVACSSSSAIEGWAVVNKSFINSTEEKRSVKAASVDHDASNLSCSRSILSHTPCQGPAFNLENLEPTSIANLSSCISELLQSNDSSSMNAGFVRSTAMKKLTVWKVDMSKALEMTETEIDSLETELKSLLSESGVGCSRTPVSSSLAGECNSKTCEDLVARPCPLQFVSSGIKIIEITDNALETELKEENIDSPGSATSKFVEVPSSGKDFPPPDTAKPGDGFLKLDVNDCREMEGCDLNEEANASDMPAHVNDFQPVVSRCYPTQATDGNFLDNGENIYNLILASNKDSANRASEVLNELLPVNQYHSSVSNLQCDPMIVKKKFLMRRRFLQFKEKVVALKFRAFRHFSKDERLLASMKIFAKSSKKLDRRFRFTRLSSQKHLPFDIPQFLYPDGILNVVSEAEVSDYVSRLLSDSQVKLCRSTLKMPALIMDEKEKMVSKFISSNGLVEDPCAVEKERSMINPWTPEEMEIFIDKLATFGKDFRKISSFLDHKTTADCVEFYYKNHKSDCFEKARKRPDFAKPKKSRSTNTYLVTSGKRWNPEANAASLDILGSASASAANVIDGMEIQRNRSSRYFCGGSYKALRIDDGSLKQRTSLDTCNNDRETVAADVLAGICGSLSSEAMGSCITSSVDLGEGYQDWRYHRVGSSTRQHLTPEVTQNVDGECSDESCEEMDPTDWTNEEMSIFIQALSSYGKDFAMISRCVRTRSRDQCKVYFSKARKCLGLDRICQSGDVVFGDVNEGGSDAEGACVLETGSIICSEKSRCKMKEDLQSPDVKLSEADLVGTVNLNPNINKYENYNGIASQDSLGTEPVIKNSAPTDFQVDNKPDLDFMVSKEQNGVNSGSAAVVDCKNAVSSDEVVEQVIEEADDLTLPNRSSSEADNTFLLEVPNWHPGTANGGGLLPEGSLNDKKVKNGLATSGETNSLSCSIRKMNCVPQPSANPSCPADMHSSLQVNILSGCQKKADFESSLVENSHTITLQQRDCFAPTISLPQFSAPTKVSSSSVGDNGIKEEQGQESVSAGDCHWHSARSLLDHDVSSQILHGYPLSESTMKDGNGNMDCKRPILLQSASKLDGNFHPDRHSGFYLQKCNGLRNHSSVPQALLPSQEHIKDHYRPQSGSSIDFEKSCGNGDVKLFGKILISSEQKPVSSVHKSDDNKTQSFNLKPLGDRKAYFNSDKAPFEHYNCLGSEHIPVRKFGFCDGNRMQIGFPHLPDSTLLLTKYPDAFSNCASPLAKLEQAGRSNVNGNSVYPTREPTSSNGAADNHVLRNQEVQPFSIDMKQQQDLYAEIQRRNRFDVVSGMQQQARGTVGINIVGRGGVLVGGQSTGVSDPVAVIRMHYAKAGQFGAQNIIIEDDSWRNKGGVGR